MAELDLLGCREAAGDAGVGVAPSLADGQTHTQQFGVRSRWLVPGLIRPTSATGSVGRACSCLPRRCRPPCGQPFAGRAHIRYPRFCTRTDQRPRWRRHPGGEWMDVVLPELPWGLTVGRLRMRGHVPDGRHGAVVDLAYLLEGEEPAVLPVSGLERLSVDPLRRVGVAPDLHVLAEGLRPDSEPSIQKRFNLAQHEGVALKRCGVVCLLVPDVLPDVLGFGGVGKAAESVVQLGQRAVEAFVYLGVSGSSLR